MTCDLCHNRFFYRLNRWQRSLGVFCKGCTKKIDASYVLYKINGKSLIGYNIARHFDEYKLNY